MKKIFTCVMLLLVQLLFIRTVVFAVPDVTITSTAVVASNLLQGSTVNVVYIAQLNVSIDPVTVNSVQVPLLGTYNASDLTLLRVYFNATAPTISGAVNIANVAPSFAGPHTYSIAGLSQAMAAGSMGYFIIAVDVSATATFGNTVKVNGAVNPLIFGFTTAPNLTNTQTDVAGTQTFSSTLPVTLMSFTAKVNNEKIELQWKTTSEINNAFFDIEHSRDGVTFTKMGRLAGKGTTNLEQSYQFFDATPLYGNNYYQLKQIDIDNNYHYSGIVYAFITINRLMVTGFYPNPVINMVRFSVIAPENNTIHIQVNDMLGRLVLQQQQAIIKGENKQQLDLNYLTSGVYYLHVTEQKGGNHFMQKIVVAK